MKKRFLNKRKSVGFTAVLAGAVFLASTSTPPSQNSDNLNPFSYLFSKNAAFSVEVHAEETGNIALDKSYLNMSADGNILYSLSRDGQEKFNNEIKEHDYKVVNVSFSDDIKPTEIGVGDGFNGNFSIKGVTFNLTLPESVETIAEGAFVHNNISSVTFGSSLKKIGKGAFSRVGLCTDLVLPEGLEELGEQCFFYNDIPSVTLPSTLTTGGVRAFEHNKIEVVNFPESYNLVGTLKDDRIPDMGEITGKIIPDFMFCGNRIKKINFPEGIVGIGSMAFARNTLQELSIPASVKNIYIGAFDCIYDGADIPNPPSTFPSSTSTIKNLVFETDADGNGIEKIAYSAFYFAGVEGHVSFPKSLQYIDEFSFMGDYITSVSFNGCDPYIHTFAFYAGNEDFFIAPHLETIENLNSRAFQKGYTDSNADMQGVFRATKHLKNVSFDYANLNPSFTEMPQRAFSEGLLKSINFPEKITSISETAFELNSGWYDGTNKVALYRVGADGKTYITDNAVADGENHVFNPVLFKLELKDQDGAPLPEASLPQNIKAERVRNGNTENLTDVKTTDFTNFKLGDKVKFTVPDNPAGYAFSEIVTKPWLTKITDREYEVTLDPLNIDAIKDVFYGDNYNVGYKSAVIELKYKKTSGGTDPSAPVVPENPPTPTDPAIPDQPATPADPAAPNQPDIDITNTDTPQGSADTEITDIDDDINPRGAAKIADDKIGEIKVSDNKSPLGALPKTGGTDSTVFTLLGIALLGLGTVLKKK